MHVAAAVDNARLLWQLQACEQSLEESIEQQTAMREILRAISGSPGRLQPVLDAVAENAARLCKADRSLYPGGGRGTPSVVPYAAWPRRRDGPCCSYPSGRLRARCSRRSRIQFKGSLKGLAQTAGYRSVVSVPMLRDGSPIGAVTVIGAEPAMFSERQIAMLQTFADQAVIAIENTRLFNELQARTAELGRSVEELKALGEVGRASARRSISIPC